MAQASFTVNLDKLPRLARGVTRSAPILVRLTPGERDALTTFAASKRWHVGELVRGLALEVLRANDALPKAEPDPRQLHMFPASHVSAEPSPRGERTKPRRASASRRAKVKRARKPKRTTRGPSKRSRKAGRK